MPAAQIHSREDQRRAQGQGRGRREGLRRRDVVDEQGQGRVRRPRVPVGEGLLGDANLDGKVDSSDASAVLGEYSELATSGNTTFKKPQQKINADVNFDNKIDSKDASLMLGMYAYNATSENKIETMNSYIEYLRTNE